MEQRWRYQKTDKTPVWLPFRADFPCLYCGYPVGHLSTSGPAICGYCACGYVRPSQEEIEERIRMDDEFGLGKLYDAADPNWRENRRRHPETPKHNNTMAYMHKARKKLDALPDDPAWAEYEASFLAAENAHKFA